MQQIANILEQPISPQTSPRKTRKRPYSLVLFIPVGAGAAPACTRKKINKKYLHLQFFRSDFRRGFGLHVFIYLWYVWFEMRKIPKIPTKINNPIDIFELF
jgi:hypothetical protein